MFTNVWRRWLCTNDKTPRACRHPRAFRPRVECLESRFAPAAGALDPSFDSDGRVIGDMDSPTAIAIQADGKIVAIGGSLDFVVARYNSDGSLDPSFGSLGMVTTPFPGGTEDKASAVAIQADGKIVVAGHVNEFGVNVDFALARYNTDGSLDTTFDGDGLLTTDFYPVFDSVTPHSLDFAESLSLQTDGRIVVSGVTVFPGGGLHTAIVVRYNPDGSLDADFDADGKTIVASRVMNSVAEHVIQPDGKILVAGTKDLGSDLTINMHDFALARLNPDGSLDQTFGSGGTVTTNFNLEEDVRGVALQSDGKIVVAGSINFHFALVRYDADGRGLDLSFSFDGIVETSFFGHSDQLASLTIQPDDKIVVVGSTGRRESFGFTEDFALARYHADGSLDRGFGTFGQVKTDFTSAFGSGGFGSGSSGSSKPSSDRARAVTLQADGRIVAAGVAETGGIFSGKLVLARYLGDTPNGIVAIGADAGGDGRVTVYDAATGTELTSFVAFDAAPRRGVRVAVGDVNGDGTPDIVAGGGPGGGAGSRLIVFQGTRSVFGALSFEPMEAMAYSIGSFPGLGPRDGIYVAAGDVNGDGAADVIVGYGEGASPRVIVLSGPTGDKGTIGGALLGSLFAFNRATRGGVRVAAGDVNGDGRADIIVSRASRGASHVRVFNGRTFRPLAGRLGNLLAFPATFRGGIFVAAGDVNGDGRADIIVGAGAGGPACVKVFSGVSGVQIARFWTYAPPFQGGVRVAVGDANGDGKQDIITGAGPDGEDEVRIYNPLTGAEIDNFFGPAARGIYVAAATT